MYPVDGVAPDGGVPPDGGVQETTMLLLQVIRIALRSVAGRLGAAVMYEKVPGIHIAA